MCLIVQINSNQYLIPNINCNTICSSIRKHWHFHQIYFSSDKYHILLCFRQDIEPMSYPTTSIRKLCLLYAMFCIEGVLCCGPGRGGYRRRSTQKLLPLVFKQHVPNVPENSLAASGPSEERIRRGDERFKMLVPNYNTDIVWADRTGTGSNRIMTRVCMDCFNLI